MGTRRFVLALTGASGSAYGRRLLECLAGTGAEVHLTVSEAAAKVAAHELGLRFDPDDGPAALRALLGHEPANVVCHSNRDFEVPVASGSFRHDGMAIVPCSMGTLGRIAHGASTNLVERAADVCLKERRKLILVPRETPYSTIHLENMLRLSQAGAIILPASPGLYAESGSVDQLVDFIVSRVLDHLGVENNLMQRYGEPIHRRHLEDE
ncbi:MAG TPA: flavin prenyltransferase UbiX [Planctomycetota bacterium]|jgi:4-hydroxy-3-polyprenylbenzoate decarboxylase